MSFPQLSVVQEPTIRIAPRIYFCFNASLSCNFCILRLFVLLQVWVPLLLNATYSFFHAILLSLILHLCNTPNCVVLRWRKLSNNHVLDYAAEPERNCHTPTPITTRQPNARNDNQSPHAALCLTASDIVASLRHPAVFPLPNAALHAFKTHIDRPELQPTSWEKDLHFKILMKHCTKGALQKRAERI